jgi:hypothetical protein
VLVVGFSRDPKKIPGVVAYRVGDGQALSGVWATGGSPNTGTEDLTPHTP